jgi:hypothetical protein
LYPSKRANISDTILSAGFANKIVAITKAGFEDGVGTFALILVSVDAVLDFLGGVAEEMVCLALHQSNSSILKKEPLNHLAPLIIILEAELERFS